MTTEYDDEEENEFDNRIEFVSKELSHTELNSLLKDLENPSQLCDAIRHNDICMISKDGGIYKFDSDLEDLQFVDRSLCGIITWNEFRPGVGKFDAVIGYASDVIGNHYEPDMDRVRLSLYITDLSKEDLLKLVAS